MLELLIWVAAASVFSSQQHCIQDATVQSMLSFNNINSNPKFKCENTNPENFLYDFGKLNIKPEEKIVNYELEITNSDFFEIEYFRAPLLNLNFQLKTLSISHSKLKFIEDYALIDAPLLGLDLSYNSLKKLQFVKTCPKTITKLLLSNNLFTEINNEFFELDKLELLDLSNCRIDKLGSNSFLRLSNKALLKLNHNKLSVLDSIIFPNNLKLDLSENNLQKININDVEFFSLDLSFINLNKSQHLNTIFKKTEHGLFRFQIFEKIKFSLNLTSTQLGPLTENLFSNNDNRINLILINSSIDIIESNTFNHSIFLTLDLSHNLLTVLKDFIFSNCQIFDLNLSNCKLQVIGVNAFYGLTLYNSLNLSHNFLTYLHKHVFHNLETVQDIDLSFNRLKKIDNNLFKYCKNLIFLNFADSFIEVIRSEAFIGPDNLYGLNLQNNFLEAVDFNTTSYNLFLNLQNNLIKQVKLSFLKNIKSKEVTLKSNKIEHLRNNTSNDLIETKVLDLSFCDIEKIEQQAFRGLTKLTNLNLKKNKVQKIESGTFKFLRSLIELDLSGNKISYFSDDSFIFGNNLQKLHITFYNIEWSVKPFVRLNYLTILAIIDSKLDIIENNAFKGLINLQNLTMMNVQVKKVVSGAFNGLTNIIQMNVSEIFKNVNTIKSNLFSGLKNLKTLNLSNLALNLIQPKAFQGLLNVKELLLNKNSLQTINNHTFLGLESLNSLNLSSNKITTLEKHCFKGLNSLKTLFLDNNQIIDLILGTFQSFPLLETLNLGKNNLAILLTGTFSNLKHLKNLDLSFNNITRLKVENFFSLSNLKILHLSGNHIIEMQHLELIASLTKLEIVAINANRWKCNDLTTTLIAFQNYSIQWESDRDPTFDEENIDGIKCYDVCKFLYCAEDYYFRQITP